jgi:HAD superfamily hydrolase (TIGR01509 family)
MATVARSTPETIRRLVFESDLEHRYETGLITGKEFVEEISRKLDRVIPVEAMLEAASAIFQPNLEMLGVLQAIRDRGIPMGLLSNTNAAHWEWIIRQNYPVVDGWFDPIVLSYEVKAMKPNRLIYDHATNEAKVAASDIFFVDDRIDNVVGAEQAGWRAEPFQDVAKLLKRVGAW